MHSTFSRAAVLAAAFLLSITPAHAAEEGLSAKAQSLVEALYPAARPGAAVIVTEHGKVVYQGASGMADVEQGTKITPGTVFRIGSITKQFSAAVLLQLVAEGKVSLDDRLDKYVPGYPEPGAHATVRQLLNHTSGIKSYTAIPAFMSDDAKLAHRYSTPELIAVFRDEPADFQPGAAWAYDNSGYVLVGAVIEAVTGKPWYEEVDERIVRPLGLKTLRYGGEEAATPGFATGYTQIDGGALAPARKLDMSVPHAAGALIGTVGDLARWSDALHHGKVVSAPLYTEMTSPTVLPNGHQDYGYGLALGKLRGHATITHSGGIFGFATDSVYIPDEDLFVAVFTNADSGIVPPGIAMTRLAALALGDPLPTLSKTAFEAKQFEPIYGVYGIEGGDATRRFFLRDGQLFTQRTGGGELPVTYAGENRFFYGPASLTWFEIRRDGDRGPVMLVHPNGDEAVERGVWKGPIPPEAPAASVPPGVLAAYAGRYSSPVAPIVVSVNEAGALTLKLGPQPNTVLRAVSESEFAAVGVDARVEFLRDGGKVTSLVIRQGGQELRATRDPETAP